MRSGDVDPATLSARCAACGWSFGGSGTPFRAPPTAPTSAAPLAIDEGELGPPPPKVAVVFEAPGEPISLILQVDTRQRLAGGVLVAYGISTLLVILGVGVGGLLPLLFTTLPLSLLGVVLFLNQTVLEVGPEVIEITHTPFPLRRRRLTRKGLLQLCVEQKRGRNGKYFAVTALHEEGQKPLLGLAPDAASARYIERKLERHLGIVDLPVAGEYQHYDAR